MDRKRWQQLLGSLPEANHATGLSMVDFSDADILSISGSDTTAFLQGQLTCDTEELVAKSILRRGALCNAKGRVIATFDIFYNHDRYIIRLPNNMGSILEDALRPYILRSQVRIKNISQQFSCVGLTGAHPILHTIFKKIPDKFQHSEVGIQWPDMIITRVCDDDLLFYVHGSWQGLDALWQACQTYCHQSSQSAWKVFCFRYGVADITPATSGLLTPHMLGLDQIGAINFNKGCYRGQEVIARTEYQGKNKRHLSNWTCHEPCHPADEYVTADNEVVGSVICCIPFENHYLVQAVVHERGLEQPLQIGSQTIHPFTFQTCDEA